MTQPKWEDLEKMTLKEIESRRIRIDYASYLTGSDSLRDVNIKVSVFEVSNLSIRLSILLNENFFGYKKHNEYAVSSQERELFIKRLERFPKLKVFKSLDGQEYKVTTLIRHSTKVLEVKLALYKIGNVTVGDLPYRIRWIWNDILDKVGREF